MSNIINKYAPSDHLEPLLDHFDDPLHNRICLFLLKNKPIMNLRSNAVFTVGCVVLLSAAACKKGVSSTHPTNGGGGTSTTDSVYNPVDPSTPATVGFFGNGWAPRTFAAPGDTTVSVSSSLVATDSLTINVNDVLVKTPPLVYGNNTNPYMGQMVTQPALMQYITDLSPNILRGPGGSLSDVYFWNGTASNPAPADAPDSILNSSGVAGPLGPWYGGNTQGWTLSLANYYNVLAQTNSTGYLTVNYGYARYGTGPQSGGRPQRIWLPTGCAMTTGGQSSGRSAMRPMVGGKPVT
jgi:hypothetical protein